MAKPARKSPGVGRNVDSSDNLDDQAILDALATEVLQKEQMAALTEVRKRSRKKAEAAGVPLAELDELYKHRDDPPSEVKAWFARKWRVFGAFFTDLKTGQMDAFSTPIDAKAAFAHSGMMAGLKGLPRNSPPELAGEDMQTWLDAHGIGLAKRKGASDQILADAAAIAGKTGAATVDGTNAGVTKKAAESVREKAAADFKADNEGEVVMVGEPPADQRYFLASEPSFPSGRRSLYANGDAIDTVDFDPSIPVYAAHAGGAGDEPFQGVKSEIPIGEMVGDDFETPQAELDKQLGRPKAKVNAKTPKGEPVEADHDDPLLLDGVLYGSKASLEAYKRRPS